MLGAPPAIGVQHMRGVVLITIVLGVLFPLVGASLLIVLALDRLVVRRVPALRATFG